MTDEWLENFVVLARWTLVVVIVVLHHPSPLWFIFTKARLGTLQQSLQVSFPIVLRDIDPLQFKLGWECSQHSRIDSWALRGICSGIWVYTVLLSFLLNVEIAKTLNTKSLKLEVWENESQVIFRWKKKKKIDEDMYTCNVNFLFKTGFWQSLEYRSMGKPAFTKKKDEIAQEGTLPLCLRFLSIFIFFHPLSLSLYSSFLLFKASSHPPA